MLITIQRGISGLPYSVNKQEFDVNGMTKEEIDNAIIQARAMSETIEHVYGSISPLDIQLAEENKTYKGLIEMLTVQSEQKSVFIRFLREAIGDERYNEIRIKCMDSNDYQKITSHSNAKSE